MICFRDMTFCEFWRDCAKAKECERPMTEKVLQQAEKWWKTKDAPIATFVNKPECHVKAENENEG